MRSNIQAIAIDRRVLADRIVAVSVAVAVLARKLRSLPLRIHATCARSKHAALLASKRQRQPQYSGVMRGQISLNAMMSALPRCWRPERLTESFAYVPKS